jgi:hypothetical protein
VAATQVIASAAIRNFVVPLLQRLQPALLLLVLSKDAKSAYNATKCYLIRLSVHAAFRMRTQHLTFTVNKSELLFIHTDEGTGSVTGTAVTGAGVTRRPSVTGATVTDAAGVTPAVTAVPPLSMTATAPAATVFSGVRRYFLNSFTFDSFTSYSFTSASYRNIEPCFGCRRQALLHAL